MVPAVDRSRALAERLEKARQECGFSEREAGRRLKNPTHYKIAIGTLRAGRSPTQATIDRIVDRFVEEGFRAAWLLTGDGPEREGGSSLPVRDAGASTQSRHVDFDREHRYDELVDGATELLVREGWSMADVRKAQRAFEAFDEERPPTTEHLAAAWRALRAAVKGKAVGERPVEDDEGEVPKRTAPRRRPKK